MKKKSQSAVRSDVSDKARDTIRPQHSKWYPVGDHSQQPATDRSPAPEPVSTDPRTPEELLLALAEVRAQAALIDSEYQTLRQQIMAKVQGELDELEEEFAPRREMVTGVDAALYDKVRSAVAAHGGSIKAGGLHAVFSRGRETWDSKGLAGYAVANPEVLMFQRVGEPIVAIRNEK